jgi:hypothetical protein
MLTKIGMCRRIVVRILNMKVQEISSLGMPLVHADGQTDGHAETSSRSSHANAPYDCSVSACDLNALLSTACH